MLARHFVASAVLLTLLSVPSPTLAQGGYFGRNKVQYQKFDFRVLKTEHFDIYYYPEEDKAAQMAARMAERWYSRLSQILDHELTGRQPIILYASAPHFRQTNTVEGEIGEGTGGVTEAYKRRIVLPFAGPIQSTDHVLGHELVHAFQYDITGTNVSANSAGALALPLWFIEGMAEYLSLGPVDPHTAMWMREAARRERLPEVDDLNNPRYFPYRYGHALWAYIGGKYGDDVVGLMLRAAAGRETTYKAAIEEVLKIDSKTLSKEWHAAEFEAYRPVAEVAQMPADFARAVVAKGNRGGRLNVSPELSPDGSRVIYFSEKDLFSIDLFLADAKTGEIIKKITNTATSAHFESLQFLSSAGAWDPKGQRFLFAGVSGGQSILTIVNVDRGKTEREIRVPEADEILNPSWSADGRYVAFSGLVGGLNDLFVYDLEASTLRRLTNDAFAELDPDWAPDGKSIVISTDRFTTNLDRLASGPMKLGLVDVASGEVKEAGGFENAKNISPQFSADGRALFFISDHQGVSNIYRMEIATNKVTQVTNLVTGASGITELSPALSVSEGRLVFSAYEDDGYTIYALDSEAQMAGGPEVPLPRNAGVLAPRKVGEGPVFAALSNPDAGLPPVVTEEAVSDYKPKMTLDFAGQPVVGVGFGPTGTYAAGGVSFLFSDMLGNHVLGTSAQVSGRFDEIGGSIFYLNRTHRWNWGASIDHIPYVARGFEAGVTTVNGRRVYVERELRLLQRDQQYTGLITYPFNRSLRIESTGGFRRIGFSEDLTTRTYDINTGDQLTDDKVDIGSEPPLNLGLASSALVYDTSIFGITSPIRGSRHRLEFSQSAGTLTYSGVLADMRTYLMPFRPYTIALRGIYFGRYGPDAEDGRLPTLYLGYPGLVRGYDSGSFETGECGLQIDGSCPAFDRLVGSRVAVANAELRFPLWSAFGGDNFYGPLPVEMALFTDAGVAWGRIQRGGAFEGDHEPVVSVGVAARVNVMNFVIAEINYVRPLDRPGRGWLWQFNFRPGF